MLLLSFNLFSSSDQSPTHGTKSELTVCLPIISVVMLIDEINKTA